MTEAEWQSATDLYHMVQFVQRKVGDRQLRAFLAACGRRVFVYLYDIEREAVRFTEQWLAGAVGEPERAALYERMQEVYGRRGSSPVALYLLDREARFVAHSVTWLLPDASQEADAEEAAWVGVLRDTVGPYPFRSVTVDPSWRTSTVLALATGVYAEKAFDRLPILADALQDAGCDNDELLDHLRGLGPHVRGCWALDLVLGKT